MNVQLLELEQDRALEYFNNYRQAVSQAHNEIDEALMKGYKALSEGKRLIDLHQVLADTGCDERHRPKLAIAPATAAHCWFNYTDGAGGGRFQWKRSITARDTRSFLEVPRGTLPPVENYWNIRCHDVVPLIPPQHRPKRGLHLYHILWEATWEDVPADPYLLRFLVGALYVVLAEWDLTELERAALRGRLV